MKFHSDSTFAVKPIVDNGTLCDASFSKFEQNRVEIELSWIYSLIFKMSGNSAEDTFFGNGNSTLLSISDNSEPDKIQLLHSTVQEVLQQIFNVEG